MSATTVVKRATRTALDVMRGVFGSQFAGPTWHSWILCAAALFGLTDGLDADDQAFIGECMGRAVLPTEPARRGFLIVGRRGGKSRFAAFLAVHLACFRDYSRILVAGESGVVMLLAPDRRQARVLLAYIGALLEAVPMLAGLVERRTAEAIYLTNGIVIEVHTSNYRAVRGFTVVAAIVDEAAFLPHDDSAEPDAELLAALEPAMATVPGALMLVISSPYARRGELYAAFRDHFGKDCDPVFVWRAATRRMNPGVPQDVIDRAYEADPARASAEYGAQFRTDVETFLSREAVIACVMPGRFALPRVAGVSYRAFLDFAGGSGGGDSATAAIAHTEMRGGTTVQVLDAILELRPPFSPEQACADFATLMKAYGVTRATSDRWGGQFPVEQMRKHGILVEPSAKAKSELYGDLLPMINSGLVELVDNGRLTAQLAGLERRTARAGRDSVDHAPGSHDDVANAVAGVMVAPVAVTVRVW